VLEHDGGEELGVGQTSIPSARARRRHAKYRARSRRRVTVRQ
jgi:hypothetical protein